MFFGKEKKERDSYGIIGLGRFGYALAESLAESGAELLVIDRDEEKVRAAREFTENAVVIHSMDKKTLKDTGIQNCDVAVVCNGENMEFSILTTLNLVSFGIPTVIAKATSKEHGEILSRLGAEVVYPERDMAIRLANRLENSKVLDFIQLSEQINISKLQVPHNFIGKSIEESGIRPKFGLNVIAIENSGQVEEIIKPSYVFRDGDVLIVSGNKENVLRLAGEE